MKVAKL
jgi:Mono-functional DNA-alkylating methyl methanesulfonate N-term